MSETFKKLSETLKKSPGETLKILRAAGVLGKKEGDVISYQEKMQVIQYLNKGKAAPRRHSSTSQFRVMRGKVAKTVNIEVRKKVAYSKSNSTSSASGAQRAASKNKTIHKTGRKKTPPMAAAKKPKTTENKVRTSPQTRNKVPKSPHRSKAEAAKEISSSAEVKPSSKAKPSGNAKQKENSKKLSISSDKRGKRTIKRPNRQTFKVPPATKHAFEKPTQRVKREVVIPDHILVADLAQGLAIKSAELVKKMMGMGIMTTINQSLDQDTAVLIVEELGHRAMMEKPKDVEARLAAAMDNKDVTVDSRPPVVVVMGHVDHGKTSLLDSIRNTKVHRSEAGGITQHIGAYHVKIDKDIVTFLDTPGHEAFTGMRARGTEVTDIAILVVAADDGVMPQTIEAIEHARLAKVPVIVAITKVDKEGIDIEKIKAEIAKHNIVPEEWGGNNIFVAVSSKDGRGINELLGVISLQAEMMELKAPLSGVAQGTVIEATLDKGRGIIATVLVKQGILRKGDILLAGMEFGRVRAILDENSCQISQISPSIPASVLGLSGAPAAGDEFIVVANERHAKEIADLRRHKQRNKDYSIRSPISHLENFMKEANQVRQSVNILLKTDTQGTAEAIQDAVHKVAGDEVKVNIVSVGVGGINVSDVNLAAASKAMILGFNVRTDAQARRAAEEQYVTIHYYSIIYELVDSVAEMVGGMLAPTIKEEIIGIAQVKNIFRSSKLGLVAGCQVIEGTVRRGNPIRVVRDNVVIFEGELESLRRYKDDVNEVKSGVECGIAVKDYNDVKLGDQIEVFQRTEVRLGS